MRRARAVLALLGTAAAQSLHPTGRGSTDAVHDVSRVSRANGTFFAFSSSKHNDIGLPLLTSTSSALSRSSWRIVQDGTAGSGLGKWVDKMWPGWMGAFWAPDVINLGDARWFLYYSAHRNIDGYNKEACVGFAVSTTPTVPASWVDYGGPLVCSFDRNDPNDFHAIDPSVILTPERELWLSFGGDGDSGGIYALQLDSSTGGLRSGTSYDPLKPRPDRAHNPVRVAKAPNGAPIEASFIDRIDGWYYLYWNADSCCAGCKSTYNIRVARSRNVTGPYVDRSGASVIGASGGEMFYDYQGGPTGKWVGPGHYGRYTTDDSFGNVFSIHYYNGDVDGCTPAMELRELQVDDGWPSQHD